MQTCQQSRSCSVYTAQYQMLKGQSELHKNVHSFPEATSYTKPNKEPDQLRTTTHTWKDKVKKPTTYFIIRHSKPVTVYCCNKQPFALLAAKHKYASKFCIFWLSALFCSLLFGCLGVIHLLLIINFWLWCHMAGSAGYSMTCDFTLNIWISTDAKITCEMLFTLFPGH